MKRVALCADDFGLHRHVDEGIADLAAAGRLGAVSCLAEASRFAADLPGLLAHPRCAAGLHLSLTEGFGAAPDVPLALLLARCGARLADAGAVERRLAAQLDAFERAAGRPPSFVDGHRHVHQLPVVRDVLVRVLGSRYPERPPLVRCTVPRSHRGAKAALVAALGGRALRRRLLRHRLPHNLDFAGVYGLGAGADYPALMRSWLARIGDGGMIMCHPGRPGGQSDPIAPARAAELRYLASAAFLEDCAAAGVALVALAELAGPAGGRPSP
ncbi:MAG TPA: ChbG/HpnK family deacetylase [Anaeromyxobacteraceae bacterium]